MRNHAVMGNRVFISAGVVGTLVSANTLRCAYRVVHSLMSSSGFTNTASMRTTLMSAWRFVAATFIIVMRLVGQ